MIFVCLCAKFLPKNTKEYPRKVWGFQNRLNFYSYDQTTESNDQ